MHSQNSRARIGRSERATQALELRKAGKTYTEIGRIMEFSEQRAHRLVSEELGRLNAKRAEEVAEVTRLELERLDAMQCGVWEKAKKGDGAAIDRLLAIMARRAKLMGLDAPTKIAPTTPDGLAQWGPVLEGLTNDEMDVMTRLAERARQMARSTDGNREN